MYVYILIIFCVVIQAALCCIRILRHLPEHVEDFMERIMGVLKDRHHGVLVAGVQLITAVVASNPKVGTAVLRLILRLLAASPFWLVLGVDAPLRFWFGLGFVYLFVLVRLRFCVPLRSGSV